MHHCSVNLGNNVTISHEVESEPNATFTLFISAFIKKKTLYLCTTDTCQPQMSCCPFLHAPFFRSKQLHLNNPQRWPKLPLMFPPVLPVLLLQLDQNYKLQQPLTKPSVNQKKKKKGKEGKKKKETMSHGQPNRPQPKQRDAPDVPMNMGSAAIDGDPITIGEALEAAAISAGEKAVDQNDADAISAAEIRATGEDSVRPGGVGATAQSAATLNSHFTRREDMAKLSDVLTVIKNIS